MSFLSESSMFMKACLLVHGLALLLFMISYIAPYWVLGSNPGANTGLWLNCVDTSCLSNDLSQENGWILSGCALETLSLALGVAAMAQIIYHICHPTQKSTKWWRIRSFFGLGFSFAAALFCQIAIVIAIHNYSNSSADDKLGWSVALNLIAVVFFATSGLFQLVEILRRFFAGPTDDEST